MVSGALLLGREFTPTSTLRRVWKIALPLWAWSAIYLKYYSLTGAPTRGWVVHILSAPVAMHFAFLYALLWTYLFLPVLSPFFRTTSSSTHWFILAIWFVGACCVPLYSSITGSPAATFNVSNVMTGAGYMLLGAVLRRLRCAHSMLALLVYIASSAATAWLTARQRELSGAPSEIYYVYSSPLVAIASAAVFVMMRGLNDRIASSGMLVAFLERVAKVSFGIYLAHLLVIAYLATRGIRFDLISPWVMIPAAAALTLFVTAILVAMIQRVPYLRSICPS